MKKTISSFTSVSILRVRCFKRIMSCLLLTSSLSFAFPTAALAVGTGQSAPAFEAPVLGGYGTISLDEYRGKVVYLDFWASWCPPCLESLPQLDRLGNLFAGRDFQILAVNVDSNPEKALAFLKRHPVSYPSASDPAGLLPKKYELRTMPTSYLIDENGVVRYVHNGFRRADFDDLHSRIKRMLERP